MMHTCLSPTTFVLTRCTNQSQLSSCSEPPSKRHWQHIIIARVCHWYQQTALVFPSQECAINLQNQMTMLKINDALTYSPKGVVKHSDIFPYLIVHARVPMGNCS